MAPDIENDQPMIAMGMREGVETAPPTTAEVAITIAVTDPWREQTTSLTRTVRVSAYPRSGRQDEIDDIGRHARGIANDLLGRL